MAAARCGPSCSESGWWNPSSCDTNRLNSDLAPVRVRFAPSPTGHFHIGGARTALYNFLLARQTGGQLILRIEDTDVKRNTPEGQNERREAPDWLGPRWDEGAGLGGPPAPFNPKAP